MPDIEIEDKVWESEVILIDSLGREGTVYRLVSDLKLDPTHKDPEPLNTYCPEGEHYARLKKSLCASLGVVEKESELFLSLLSRHLYKCSQCNPLPVAGLPNTRAR
ncbi:hypothetical protein FVEG_14858 [Fusarium verticillioides 7600]|uniref:Uncharacterized protein n=1 Tax=Gibberella moniliformis (strain M3125 / FGSC 7600) TaxID=334819 RepID=W7LIF3_GIBM7|nr:hypothetical protein FVEG_14858 [Fusarium verticillioides 7600]EWG38286.1 hypothetical protein FVEG_14858 [Fusarium verticillioides 7600]